MHTSIIKALILVAGWLMLSFTAAALAAPPVDVGKAPGRLIIRAMDSNNDGWISREEFKPLKRGSRWEWFADADTDRDEQLTRVELEASLVTVNAQDPEGAMSHFEQSDLDDDGTVTLEELRDLLFVDFDINEDGQLDETELGSSRQDQRRSAQGGKAQQR